MSEPATVNRWAKGKDGEEYPVAPGQVWRVGQHVFVCNDVMASTALDDVLADHPPTLVYCDPPWGQGLVNTYRSKAGLGRADYTWQDLYRRIADLGHSRGLPIWMEASARGSRDGGKVLLTMMNEQAPFTFYWEITWSANTPAGLYFAGPGPYPRALDGVLTGMLDRDTPGVVMRAYGETGTVLDPSCGLGATPFCAHKAGWSSVNGEINPYRMSAALVRLAKATGLPAERVE